MKSASSQAISIGDFVTEQNDFGTALVMVIAVATTVLLCLLLYASSVGKLLEGSSVTGYRVSKYHVNRVNSGTFPAKPPRMQPKRFKTFYYETTPVASKTFWIFVQCGRALILQCCSALLQNLVGNSGETLCLEEAEQPAEASVDVPLQIVNSIPFCLFSLYLYPHSAPFLN